MSQPPYGAPQQPGYPAAPPPAYPPQPGAGQPPAYLQGGAPAGVPAGAPIGGGYGPALPPPPVSQKRTIGFLLGLLTAIVLLGIVGLVLVISIAH